MTTHRSEYTYVGDGGTVLSIHADDDQIAVKITGGGGTSAWSAMAGNSTATGPERNIAEAANAIDTWVRRARARRTDILNGDHP